MASIALPSGTVYIPPQDAYRGHRAPSWALGIVGGSSTVDGLQSIDIKRSASASIKGRGTITVADTGQGIDWGSVRLAPRYSTGAGAEWGIGHFVAMAPREQWDNGARFWQLDVYDINRVLERKKLTDTHQVPAGANIAAAIADLITLAGETRTAITNNGATLRTAKTYDVGTSVLAAINDLADTGNYFALAVDDDGRFTLSPYVLPSARAARHVFASGAQSIHSGKFTVDRNVDVPDQIIAVVAATDEQPALVGYAPDAGSYPYAETVETDATSLEGANAYAARVLAGRRAASTELVLNHAPMPLMPNDVIEFSSRAAGISARFVLTSTSEPKTALDLAQSTFAEVD